MTRTTNRAVFTISFIVTLLILVSVRTGRWKWLPPRLWNGVSFGAGTRPNDPQDAIYGMLDAARKGDTKTYLDAFSGPMHDELLQVVKENPDSNFAAYLRSQNSAFESVALSVADRSSDNEAQVRVEYVYTNRNEVQNVFLRRQGSRWRILRVESAEQVKTLVPFGTAVTD